MLYIKNSKLYELSPICLFIKDIFNLILYV